MTPERESKISDSGLLDILKSPYGENSKTKEEVMRSLGFSSPFLALLDFIKKSGNFEASAIIDMGPEFKAHFRREVEDSFRGEINWGDFLQRVHPNILQEVGLADPLKFTKQGWHSVQTHADKTYAAIGSILDHGDKLDISKEASLVRKFGAQPKSENIRYSSEELEDISGFRPGRFSLFLGDDVLPNFSSIVLDKHYAATQLKDSESVMFTVHASFFFICKKRDLLVFMKTNEARSAFRTENFTPEGDALDPLRIEGFSFPANQGDFNLLQEYADFNNDGDLVGKAHDEIPDQVPADKRSNAISGKIQSFAKGNAPHYPNSTHLAHLDWKSEAMIQMIREKLTITLSSDSV